MASFKTARATSLTVSGTSTLAGTTATTLTTSGATSLADTSAAALTVSGNTVLQGSVTLAQPQGDISMGIYGE